MRHKAKSLGKYTTMSQNRSIGLFTFLQTLDKTVKFVRLGCDINTRRHIPTCALLMLNF